MYAEGMATCYRCGRIIDPSHKKLRRKVKTGEWIRKAYSTNRVGSVRTAYGPRIVCQHCANAIDLQQDRAGTFWLIQLGLWLCVLLILAIINS